MDRKYPGKRVKIIWKVIELNENGLETNFVWFERNKLKGTGNVIDVMD